MDSFPFTQKKLLNQPVARRHKLVSQWLRETYERLLKEPFGEQNRLLFLKNYHLILSWLEEKPPHPGAPDSHQCLIEFVSDQFHYHKSRSGIGIAEPDFLPRVLKGDKDESSPWQATLPYRVALDNLRSAFNVGSIFRIADATGFKSVIVGNKTPGKEVLQVEKTAMGCTRWIPQEKQLDLADALSKAGQAGDRVIGIETVEDSANCFDFAWPERGIIVLGNEEYGLSQSVLKSCDTFIHLPMMGRKNSVNVANAFAVIAFQISHTFNPEL